MMHSRRLRNVALRLSCAAALASPATASPPVEPSTDPASSAAPTRAEPLPPGASGWDALNLNGSVRGGFFGSSRQLDGQRDMGSASAWLKLAPSLGDTVAFVADGWVRNDDVARGGTTQSRLIDGYLTVSTGALDIKLGKQIFAWGRADAFNPTDNLSPHDYTLLVPETDDQRMGTLAATATWHQGDYAFQASALPHFAPNVTPLDRTTGLQYRQPRVNAKQGALRIDHTGGAADWSLSYFSGLDLNPVLAPIGSAYDGVVQLNHPRVNVLGGDIATTVGHYGLRAEAAYTWMPNSQPSALYQRHPDLYVIGGGDRTFGDYLNVNLQYYFRKTIDYRAPNQVADPAQRGIELENAILTGQQDRFQHGMTLRISDQWLHETLQGELAAACSFTRHDFALRPKLVYAFTDRLKGTIGADLYRGNRQTFFGQLRDISSGYAELKYSF